MKKLSKSQQKIYDFLKEKAQYGVPPSVREICAATGLKSTSTMNRSIHIEGTEETTQVPILGRVTAGLPVLAIEEVQGYLPYSARHAAGKELFALHVDGMSMKNAGILDGDYVIAERTPTADDGAIVVALIEDEATVKRLYREKDTIRLQPENPDFEPIYSQNVSVLGKVVAVLRYY